MTLKPKDRERIEERLAALRKEHSNRPKPIAEAAFIYGLQFAAYRIHEEMQHQVQSCVNSRGGGSWYYAARAMLNTLQEVQEEWTLLEPPKAAPPIARAPLNLDQPAAPGFDLADWTDPGPSNVKQ
jgi:hypothetical protein